MTDELASFFAKKASKAKKKGVIRLQEVADQLERRARIQDELDENDAKIESEPTTTKTSSNNNNDNEDSEWLDFDDKPVLPPVIKEMADVDIELEEEEKRSSAEPIKTWNFNNNENIDVLPHPVTPQKVKYEPKAASRAKQNPLDLTNKMSFPSLSDADEVEKIQKKAEEENILREIEEKKIREEKLQKQQQRYEPRFESKNIKNPKNVPSSDEPDNWRAASETTMAANKSANIARQPVVKKSIPTTDEPDNWRMASETTTAEIKSSQKILEQSPTKNDSDNWRTNTTEAITTEIKPKNAGEQPVKKTYVPPSMRAKQREQ
ncbi:hypothetical protein ACQ4LE_011154 [Meloidogyne hapla]|uniref:Uncharacterized protein n=1 Tax=Meloidogyne hapla TaxID=6305 RepID=A0A1I8B260_MELHA